MSEMRYAVVRIGGLQYRVSEGSIIKVQAKIGVPAEPLEFDEVLAVQDNGALSIGGGRVVGTVLRHGRARKVVTFKKKIRKGYTKKIGHRQDETTVRVDSISA